MCTLIVLAALGYLVWRFREPLLTMFKKGPTDGI